MKVRMAQEKEWFSKIDEFNKYDVNKEQLASNHQK